jgi:DNA-binding GntR family transcriptional regulator
MAEVLGCRLLRTDVESLDMSTRKTVGRLAPVSVVEALLVDLRERILRGDLPPGTALPEVELADEYKVSRPTVKTALTVLVEQGMLRREANHPAVVPHLSRADVVDLFFVRIPLELEVVRHVVCREVPAGAIAAVEYMRALPDEDKPEVDFVNADLGFHRHLVDSVGSPRLTRLYGLIQGEIHLSMMQSARSLGRDRISAEHAAVLEALQVHDEELAVKRMRNHLQGARDTLAELIWK